MYLSKCYKSYEKKALTVMVNNLNGDGQQFYQYQQNEQQPLTSNN